MIQVINRSEKIKAAMGTKVINIMRGTSLGNPYKIDHRHDRMSVLKSYRVWLFRQIKAKNQKVLKALYQIRQAELQGMDVFLSCCCKPHGCHGDIIKSCVEWMIKVDSTQSKYRRFEEAYAFELNSK